MVWLHWDRAHPAHTGTTCRDLPPYLAPHTAKKTRGIPVIPPGTFTRDPGPCAHFIQHFQGSLYWLVVPFRRCHSALGKHGAGEKGMDTGRRAHAIAEQLHAARRPSVPRLPEACHTEACHAKSDL